MPDVNSIDIQSEIKWYMRPHLIDFLIEAHSAFMLLPETLYLTVNLLDRYCSKRIVYKRHYQLVGCSAMLIASKYGDRKDRIPTVRELRTMCCGLYEEDMFLQMEWHVLATLNWTIGAPTVDHFLQMSIADGPYDSELEHLTWYICEFAMYHREFVAVMPSIMARSALALARLILGRPAHNEMEWAGQYDTELMMNITNKLQAPSEILAKKYANTGHFCVSIKTEHFLHKQAELARQAEYEAQVQQDCVMNDAIPTINVDAMPHTPSKTTCGDGTTFGLITPPITPDGPFPALEGVTADSTHPSVMTQFLTPPSSAEQVKQTQYEYGTVQSRAMSTQYSAP